MWFCIITSDLNRQYLFDMVYGDLAGDFNLKLFRIIYLYLNFMQLDRNIHVCDVCMHAKNFFVFFIL